MVTLISWSTSGGSKGRCDAKCYEAREPACDCICGGRNHGAGLQRAIENTTQQAQGWISQARARGFRDFRLASQVQSEPLF